MSGENRDNKKTVGYITFIFAIAAIAGGLALLIKGLFSGAEFISYFVIVLLIYIIYPFRKDIKEISFKSFTLKMREADDLLKQVRQTMVRTLKLELNAIMRTSRNSGFGHSELPSDQYVDERIDKFIQWFNAVNKDGFKQELNVEIMTEAKLLSEFQIVKVRTQVERDNQQIPINLLPPDDLERDLSGYTKKDFFDEAMTNYIRIYQIYDEARKDL
ncbi:hypothetical protein [Photobacterium angustum]|uniref:Uncharacterized protein n=1 Tax=Photobacterium angustum TaxID=661 RepID=A0A855SEL1_PHOAN|nr:hypothetical protein [Photobacterium angustum]KJG49885.1 hypothetical protein UA30_05020 [Photobacterium angustum]KJG54024.1 hypothetical protein UA34_07135 [Photobacterium angustum]PSX08587.1 hypothetical protein C0W41_05720 [Photobacterium angustum]PSX13916.1 hypothetical protein C0W55_12955 [Photobacterium angustum]PSX23032.1 hypothetical protein C0W36_13515 [Photobacterium angustum]